MLLVDGVAYRIDGSFYKGGVYQPIPTYFQGKILAGRLGSFSGVMFDIYGPSIVKGHIIANIEQNRLEFEKEYDRESRQYHGGSDLPIEHYLVQAKSGGWMGTWRIPADESGRGGHVILAIVPWQDNLPVYNDPVDYITLSKALSKA